ncbi:MAG: hypothetical protein K8S25_08145 [Alphaproteobacteria bacterium]|nr:hypothetical protein [Alphaproteobacteria bacterium]
MPSTPDDGEDGVIEQNKNKIKKIHPNQPNPATFVPAADNTIFATYKLNGRHMIATVSLTDFKVLMTKDLSEYEPK